MVPEARSDASKLVKLAPLIAGSVPVMFAAGRLVKLAPDAAGNVAGNLASGIVPESSSDALSVVSEAPEPLKVVAVIIHYSL